MWKRLNSNQMCEQFSYKEVFLIRRFLIERFYCIYILLLSLLLSDLGNASVIIEAVLLIEAITPI